MVWKIPLLREESDQILSTELDGVPYGIRITWNTTGEYWSMTLSDADDNIIIAGVKLIKNYPLFRFHKSEKLPKGQFVMLQTKANIERPRFEDLNSNFWLCYIPKDELSDAI